MTKALQICALVLMGLSLLGASFYAGYLVGQSTALIELMLRAGMGGM